VSDWRDFLDWSATNNLVSFFRPFPLFFPRALCTSAIAHILRFRRLSTESISLYMGMPCTFFHYFINNNLMVDLATSLLTFPALSGLVCTTDRAVTSEGLKGTVAPLLPDSCAPVVSFQPRDCHRLCGLGGDGKPRSPKQPSHEAFSSRRPFSL
jgi:hypothetical protein